MWFIVLCLLVLLVIFIFMSKKENMQAVFKQAATASPIKSYSPCLKTLRPIKERSCSPFLISNMYQPCANPLGWGFLYSPDRCPVIMERSS
jgi:hypothetical protein